MIDFIVIGILISIFVLCGSIAGLIAYFSTKKLQEHLNALNTQMIALKSTLKELKRDVFKNQFVKYNYEQKTESTPTPSQVFSQTHLNPVNPVADNVVKKAFTNTSPQPTIQQDSQVLEQLQASPMKTATDTPAIKTPPKVATITQSQPFKQKDFFDFEWLFTQRVMVFLAGIFFIFAAFFLIRYSLEHNLLTPAVRISLCICFGAILFTSGISLHFAHHRSIFYRIYTLALHNLKRITKAQPNVSTSHFSMANLTLQTITQTLIGSSLVVLFFSFYGGFKIYGFFGDFFTLITLSLIALIGLGLSVRFGVIIGIFGLLGGFATPILLSSGYYNAPFLFGYLGIFYIISMYCVLRYAQSKPQLIYLIMLANILMALFSLHFIIFYTMSKSDLFIAFLLCVGMFLSNILLLAKFHTLRESPVYNSFIAFSILSPVCFVVCLFGRDDMAITFSFVEYAFLAVLCVLTLLIPCMLKNLSSFVLHTPLIATFLSIVALFIKIDNAPFLPFCIIFMSFISVYLFIFKHKILYLWLQFMVVCGFSIMMDIHNKDVLYVYSVWFAMIIFVYSYIYKHINTEWAKAKSLDYLLLLYSVLCVIGALNLSNMPFVIWVSSGLILAYLGGQILKRNIAYFEYIFIALGILANVFSKEGLFYIDSVSVYSPNPNIFITLSALFGKTMHYHFSTLLLSLGSCAILLFILKNKSYAFHTCVNIILLSICCISAILIVQDLCSIHLFGHHLISYPLSTLCIGFLALIMGKYLSAINTLSIKAQQAYAFIVGFLCVKFYYDVVILGIFAYNPLIMLIPHWNLYDMALLLIGLIGCLLIAWHFQSIFTYFQTQDYMFKKDYKHIISAILYVNYSLIFALGLIVLLFGVAYGFYVYYFVGDFIHIPDSTINWDFWLMFPLQNYTYSVTLVLSGVILLYFYIKKHIKIFRIYSLLLFILATSKVFLLDTSSFGGIAKIVLFIFMGIVFLLLSYIYSRYIGKEQTKA
ncbi:DUF2339 domain-containing protein [Helicobacter japonicus]|uniref:DUF2339 domain-containing protein n=8 Tax=Helicobacter japonicus TaxID=425400 RepID=A0A4U8TND7_9HELI|nr:DUF2339 domain-containing protein [Helicobacter japonicus]TLE02042.1 DUF2339 domain-containing protein [Helicobacter japonicus]